MEFEKIREFHARTPFEAFDILLLDSRVYSVDRPEFLLQARNRSYVTVTDKNDQAVRIMSNEIASLITHHKA